jgi:hypothetical protein
MSEDSEFDELAPWLVIIITLIGGFLRMLLLDAKGLSLDETLSVWLANQSIPEMLQWVIRIDQHPPLYYLLLHYWIALNGATAYDVRLLSVVCGTGTIPIIYLIGKRMSGTVMGVAAAVILALSPFHIYFAQETRMYTLLMFNAAVAIYAFVRLLTDSRSTFPIGSQFREYLNSWRNPVPLEQGIRSEREFSYKDEIRNHIGWRTWILRRRWLPIRAVETDLAWVVFIVFSAAAILSHNMAFFFPLATNIIVLGLIFFQRTGKSESQLVFQAPSFHNWIKAQIGILVLWVPWLFFFIRQTNVDYQPSEVAEPTWAVLLQVLKSFLNAPVPLPAGQAPQAWSLYVLVLCLGIVHFRKKFIQFIVLAALFTIPFLGTLTASIWRPIYWDRTLIWTTIPLFLVLAAGIAQFRFRFLVIIVLGCLATLNLFAASDYFRFYQKEDWSSAAGYVALFAEKDDLVLFNSNVVEIPFNYYFETYEEGYSIQVEKRGVPLDLFESGISGPTMTTNDIPALISILSGYKRVWLVYSQDSYTDPMGLIPQTLASRMTLTRTREFHGGQAQLYVNP